MVLRPEDKTYLIVPIISNMCRRGYNIKMDLKEMGCDSVNYVKLALNRVQWRSLRTQ
jgi:hypothetical protein